MVSWAEARCKGQILNSGKILLFDKPAAQMHEQLVEWIEWLKLNWIEMNQLKDEILFLML